RGGRSVRDWRASLREIARRNATYRSTGLSPEDLQAVLESPTASVERRIGAAIVLTERATEGRSGLLGRIRIAAEACACERVRVALERVAEGELDDAAIEGAISAEDKPAFAVSGCGEGAT